jgi:hypothetical protein
LISNSDSSLKWVIIHIFALPGSKLINLPQSVRIDFIKKLAARRKHSFSIGFEVIADPQVRKHDYLPGTLRQKKCCRVL